jgi:hypothetical protein
MVFWPIHFWAIFNFLPSVSKITVDEKLTVFLTQKQTNWPFTIFFIADFKDLKYALFA